MKKKRWLFVVLLGVFFLIGMFDNEEAEQNEEVAKVVKAFHDLCEAASKLDPQHQQIAFQACLAQFAVEQRWK